MSVPVAATGVLLDRAAAAPEADIADLAPGPVLVVAPHPDDETLGCGAAIVAALARGVPVTVALLSDGGASHPASRSHPREKLEALRRDEFAAALRALAAGAGPAARLDAFRLGLADTDVAAGTDAAVDRLCREAVARDVAALWCTSRADPHADHVAAAAIADAVCARLPLARRDFAVWSRFGDAGAAIAPATVRRFGPGPFAAAKRAAMACYPSQLAALIADDPDGFVMPAALVAHFATAPEVFSWPA